MAPMGQQTPQKDSVVLSANPRCSKAFEVGGGASTRPAPPEQSTVAGSSPADPDGAPAPCDRAPVGLGIPTFEDLVRELEATRSKLREALLRPAASIAMINPDAANDLLCLTARQRQVLSLVLDGQPSKNIASDLGISRRTIENHRACIMKKMHAKSLPQLTRVALAATGG